MNVAAPSSFSRRLIIRASAGSGKTFQLALRFVKLLAEGHACDEILATTFTRKAAGEILGRVLTLLADGALQTGDPAQMRELAHQAGVDEQDCRRLLARMTSQLHRVRVCTLDSFFAQVARTYSLELGLPPQWVIVDELGDSQLRRRAIAAVLREEDSRQLMRLMYLITQGHAARGVAQLMLDTVDDLYLLFLEADEGAWKAVGETLLMNPEQWGRAVDQLREVEPPQDRRIQKSISQSLDFLASEQWAEFLGQGIPNRLAAGGDRYYNWTISNPLRDALQPLMQQAAALIVRQLSRQTAATYDLLAVFHRVYEKLKSRERTHRFEDVTRRLGSLGKAGGVEGVSLRLDGRIEQLLVDEFQDTSPAQWRALAPFALHAAADHRRSFFCVGDVKQAIYGWRGGEARLFDTVEQRIDDIAIQTICQSYRSGQAVIRTVNRIFSETMLHAQLGGEREAIQDWLGQFEAHQSSIPREGYAVLQGVASDAAGESSKEDREQTVFQQAAREAAALAAARPDLSIGVLVRKNEAVAKMVSLLREQKAHASEEGGNPLTDSAAVLAILAAMQLADHPGDTVARFHLAQSPLADWLQIRDAQDEPGALRASQLLRRRLLTDGYGPTVLVLAQPLLAMCGERESHRLGQLMELAYGYQEQATLRPARFVRFVQRTKRDEPSAANLRVMTVHQSKGLQFDAVFLPQLEIPLVGQPPSCVASRPDPGRPIDLVFRYVRKDLAPWMPAAVQDALSQTTRRTITESLCLLYVAVTRAKTALFMYVPTSKRLDRSYAGLLCAALHQGPPVDASQPLYVAGDPQWWRSADSSPGQRQTVANSVAEDAPQPAAEDVPAEISLAPPVQGGPRSLEHQAPSGRHAASVRVGSCLPTRGQRSARRRGELIHRFLEQVRWIEDGLPTDQHLRRLAVEFVDLESQWTSLLAQFRRIVAQPVLQRVLSRQSYQLRPEVVFDDANARLARRADHWEVHRERSFALMRDGRLLHGQIDRLVLGWEGDQPLVAEVIDYKTDQDDQGALQRHGEQLEDYCWAVRQMYHLPQARVAGRLLLLASGQEMTCPPR